MQPRTINLSTYTRLTHNDGTPADGEIPYYLLDDLTPPANGLMNNSSRCWINSLMQSLLSLAPLYEAVRLASRPTPVARMFAEMFRAAHGRTPPQSCEAFLETIAACKTTKHHAFNFAEQNCAQEAYTLIMECIGSPADHVTMLQRRLWEICPSCNKESENRIITSNYLDVYSRELARVGFERVAPLTTPYGFSTYLTALPSLRNTFVCASCKHVADRLLTFSGLETARSIVTVVLHKYAGKILTLYPLQLSFPAVHRGELIYDLCAVIRHYGTMSSGHYTAVVRRGNPISGTVAWYLCNDASVSAIDTPTPTAEDYMLFYVLRGVFDPPTQS